MHFRVSTTRSFGLPPVPVGQLVVELAVAWPGPFAHFAAVPACAAAARAVRAWWLAWWTAVCPPGPLAERATLTSASSECEGRVTRPVVSSAGRETRGPGW